MRAAILFFVIATALAAWVRGRIAARGRPRIAWGLAALLIAPALAVLVRQAVPYAQGPVEAMAPSPVAAGVSYERRVQVTPRHRVAHVLRVDLRAPGIRLEATRPDFPGAALPFRARTTSQFVRETGAVAAINGDFFEPWRPSLLREYPKPGDPVRPLGETWSEGEPLQAPGAGGARMAFGPGSHAAFGESAQPGGDVVGGLCMIVRNGTAADLAACRTKKPWQLHPRSAVGLDHVRSLLWLVVVDGRQPRYSVGAELEEVAELMLELGVSDAMSLDGGGSSALALRAADGQVQTVSSPIAGGLPGRERPVANHLGVFFDGAPAP